MTKTSYVVSGSTPFMGHAPGEKFDAELGADQERRALARGSIKRAPAKAAKTEDKEGGPSDANG